MPTEDPQDHLARLEAEAHLLRGRIRTLADAGETEGVIRLYRRIPELRSELDAVRHVVARQVRKQTKQYGENTELNRAEHRLAELLATLGVPEDPGLRRVLG